MMFCADHQHPVCDVSSQDAFYWSSVKAIRTKESLQISSSVDQCVSWAILCILSIIASIGSMCLSLTDKKYMKIINHFLLIPVTVRPSADTAFTASQMFCHCCFGDVPVTPVLTLWKITCLHFFISFNNTSVSLLLTFFFFFFFPLPALGGVSQIAVPVSAICTQHNTCSYMVFSGYNCGYANYKQSAMHFQFKTK